MLQQLPKLALVILLGCSALWAQAESSASQRDDSGVQSSQSSEPASETERKTLAEQTARQGVGDSTKLEAIKAEKAQYPDQAREKQLQGQVLVKILVSETGDVESAEIVSGDPLLADAAVHAVKKWKFKPFIKNGTPVRVSTTLPFDFAFSEKIMQRGVSEDRSTVTGPPKPPASSAESERPNLPGSPVPVSSGLARGLLVHQVAPGYPPDARRAHIEGVVLLRAIINKEGGIEDLKLISGPQELAAAAIGAVQQWRYRPYLLKGEPVKVDTQIQVHFQLR